MEEILNTMYNIENLVKASIFYMQNWMLLICFLLIVIIVLIVSLIDKE